MFAKYYAIFLIELRQKLAYTWDFVLGNIAIVLFFYVLLQIWIVTLGANDVAILGAPGGYTWETLIWFLAAGQILYFSVETEAQLEIQHDVITGNIVIAMARPYDYLLGRLASMLAHVVMSFVVAFPAAFIVAWIASGTIAVTPIGIAAFLIAFVLRTLLYFTLQAIAGLASFWVEKSTAFVWLIGLLILVFGGGAVPLEFWPEGARQAVELTPFPVMMYYPARLMIDPDPLLFATTIARAAIWLAILGGITGFVYSRALRRLDLNGG